MSSAFFHESARLMTHGLRPIYLYYYLSATTCWPFHSFSLAMAPARVSDTSSLSFAAPTSPSPSDRTHSSVASESRGSSATPRGCGCWTSAETEQKTSAVPAASTTELGSRRTDTSSRYLNTEGVGGRRGAWAAAWPRRRAWPRAPASTQAWLARKELLRQRAHGQPFEQARPVGTEQGGRAGGVRGGYGMRTQMRAR
eukprot:scaffold36298_cov122-Isochrysis_galbana.AAC.23